MFINPTFRSDSVNIKKGNRAEHISIENTGQIRFHHLQLSDFFDSQNGQYS